MPPTINLLTLDTGTGPDENPVSTTSSGHTWDTVNSIQPATPGQFLRRVSNRLVGQVAQVRPESYINSTSYVRNQAAEFEFAVVPTGGSEYAYIHLLIQNPGTAAVNFVFAAINGLGATTHGYTLADSPTFLGSATIAAPLVGDRLRLEFINNVLYHWTYTGGVYTLTNSSAMNPFSGTGFVGIELTLANPTTGLINFKGGDENTTLPGSTTFLMCGA